MGYVSHANQLPVIYQQLLNIAELNNPELGADWWQLLIDHGLNADESPQFWFNEITVPQSGYALLPLCSSLRQHHHLRALTNCYTTLYNPIINGVGGNTALTELLIQVRQVLRPATLILRPLAQNTLPQWHECLDNAGWLSDAFFCFGNWYLPTTGLTYERYYAERPAALRHTLARKNKKFSQHGRGQFRIITGGAELENAIDAYQTIYAASWKSPEPFPYFIPQLIRQLAVRGELRLGFAMIDNTPAATQLWIVTQQRAAICKLAYDPRFAEFSPGSLLTAHLMQHVITVDNVTEIDYLIGDDSYKRDWMTHRRERWGILATNPFHWRGLMNTANHRLRSSIKKLLHL
ncbi:GNAT family N-acetyltransferase [Thiospirillum jenense]|nr:GNAT family N-acetyltransferase [Thiospirillum jenense]